MDIDKYVKSENTLITRPIFSRKYRATTRKKCRPLAPFSSYSSIYFLSLGSRAFATR